jgi:hypothetical protein
MNEMFQLQSDFEIRYRSLCKDGSWLAFPCDCAGHVDIDALTSRAKENYLYARAMVGRDYAHPLIAKIST